MRARHTPGPWKARGRTVSCAKGVVVEVHNYPDATPEEQAAVLADAKLVAVAPEMAELLEAIADPVGLACLDEYDDKLSRRVVAVLRKAGLR